MSDYSAFSDEASKYDIGKELAPLTLNLKSEKVILPLVRTYKYLGIHVNRNLRITDHLKFLRKKTNFIINAFISIRKASLSVKFCHNTWQLFIRPLLDYTSTYLSYVPACDKELIWVMYRQTLRRMLFLKPYTNKQFADCMIQYPYWQLPEKFLKIDRQKADERLNCVPRTQLVTEKVDFGYTRLDFRKLTPKWITVMNMHYFRGECKIC